MSNKNTTRNSYLGKLEFVEKLGERNYSGKWEFVEQLGGRCYLDKLELVKQLEGRSYVAISSTHASLETLCRMSKCPLLHCSAELKRNEP